MTNNGRSKGVTDEWHHQSHSYGVRAGKVRCYQDSRRSFLDTYSATNFDAASGLSAQQEEFLCRQPGDAPGRMRLCKSAIILYWGGVNVTERVLFSLWSGPLPAIAELHFRSTLHHMGDSEYHLFLDSSSGYEGEVTEEFLWLLDDPRVTVTPINLFDYLESHGIKLPDRPRHLVPTKAVRRWFRVLFTASLMIKSVLTRFFPKTGSRFKALPHGVHYIPSFKSVSAGHGFRPWRQEEDLSYRADLFRVLAPEFFPQADVLWLDLDVAVLRDLSWLDDSPSLVYRWGTNPFGNNAVIFLPRHDTVVREGLVTAMRDLGAARPWTLFSDSVCSRLGIAVANVAEFDPHFDQNSPLYKNPSGFFEHSAEAGELSEKLMSDCKMLHWHNGWRLQPGPESVYGKILQSFISGGPASTKRPNGEAAE